MNQKFFQSDYQNQSTQAVQRAQSTHAEYPNAQLPEKGLHKGLFSGIGAWLGTKLIGSKDPELIDEPGIELLDSQVSPRDNEPGNEEKSAVQEIANSLGNLLFYVNLDSNDRFIRC